MNEGVKILLERMKTNPEEFVNGTKWAGLIHGYKEYLSEEDNKALEDAWRETVAVAMQEKFTKAVMKELLAPEEDNSLGKRWYTGHPTGMLSAGTTLGAYANTANLTLTTSATTSSGLTWENREPLSHAMDAQRYQTEQMRRHLDAHRETMKHETLYGKLKNYLHSDT